MIWYSLPSDKRIRVVRAQRDEGPKDGSRWDGDGRGWRKRDDVGETGAMKGATTDMVLSRGARVHMQPPGRAPATVPHSAA